MNIEEIFKTFLIENEMYIDFNGSLYTLSTKENVMQTVTRTPEEMFQYIQGHNDAEQTNKLIIEELEKRNEINIQNYEKIIKEMSAEEIQVTT